VLFDHDGKIKRYKDVKAILYDWFGLRNQLYIRRKEYLLAKLNKEFETLRNKARFIKAVIEEEVQIKRVKKQIIAQ
jgi:DNA topoisomerase-2